MGAGAVNYSAWGRSWLLSWLAAWGLTEEDLPKSPIMAGWVARPRRKPRERRLALAPGAVAGQSTVGVRAVREVVRAAIGQGAGLARLQPVRELVRAVVVSGATAARVELRRETVPVFAEDELMVLAAWAGRWR